MNTLLSMAFSTKSTLDMVTEPSSEDESDSEIENDNTDDENEPEYDVETEDPLGDSSTSEE